MRNRFFLAKTADINYLQEIHGFRRVLLEIEEVDWMGSIPFTRSNNRRPLLYVLAF
jgi:hypothetical protein